MKHNLGIIISSLLIPAAVHAQWFGQVGAGYEFNNNLANAQAVGDIKSDSAFSMNTAIGHYFQLADYTGLSWSVDAGGSHYLRFNGLNNVYYGTTASLRQKFGLGEMMPWLSVSGSAAHHDVEHDLRSGWRYSAAVKLGKRLSERWELQIGYRFEARRADQIHNLPSSSTDEFYHHEGEEEEEEEYPPIAGDAFNLDAHSLSLTGLFSVTERLSAHASYTRREGGLTATSLKNMNAFAAADAITEDSVFGSERYAYRVQARSNIYSAGLSWALNGHSSLNVAYEYIDSQAGHGVAYNSHLAHLNLLYNY